MQTMI